MSHDWRARWQRLTHGHRWWLAKAAVMAAGICALGRWALDERAVSLWDWALLQGFLVTLASMLCFAQRFRTVMGIGGIRLQLVDALRITTLSVFWHFFVPLSVGAELTRFTRIRAHAPGRSALEIGAILVLDHAIGAVVLFTLASLLLVTLNPFGRWSFGIPLAMVMLGMLAGGVLRISGRWPSQQIRLLWTERRAVLAAAGWSAAMHLLLAAAVWIGSRHWHLPIDYPRMALVMTGSGLFHMVPINVAGAGASDVAGLGFYLTLGLSRAEALLLVSLLYSYRLATGLLGGWWELLASRHRA